MGPSNFFLSCYNFSSRKSLLAGPIALAFVARLARAAKLATRNILLQSLFGQKQSIAKSSASRYDARGKLLSIPGINKKKCDESVSFILSVWQHIVSKSVRTIPWMRYVNHD